MLANTVCCDGKEKNGLNMCTNEFHNPCYEHLWNHIDNDFCAEESNIIFDITYYDIFPCFLGFFLYIFY